jgi:hypothetical protein
LRILDTDVISSIGLHLEISIAQANFGFESGDKPIYSLIPGDPNLAARDTSTLFGFDKDFYKGSGSTGLAEPLLILQPVRGRQSWAGLAG